MIFLMLFRFVQSELTSGRTSVSNGRGIITCLCVSFLAVDHLPVFLTLCHRLFAGLLATIMVFKLFSIL